MRQPVTAVTGPMSHSWLRSTGMGVGAGVYAADTWGRGFVFRFVPKLPPCNFLRYPGHFLLKALAAGIFLARVLHVRISLYASAYPKKVSCVSCASQRMVSCTPCVSRVYFFVYLLCIPRTVVPATVHKAPKFRGAEIPPRKSPPSPLYDTPLLCRKDPVLRGAVYRRTQSPGAHTCGHAVRPDRLSAILKIQFANLRRGVRNLWAKSRRLSGDAPTAVPEGGGLVFESEGPPWRRSAPHSLVCGGR